LPLFTTIDIGRVVERHDPGGMQLEAAWACRAYPGLRPFVLIPHAAVGRRCPAACAV